MSERRSPTNGRQVEQGNRQRARILDFIAEHQAEHGWAPTVREISVELGGLSLSSVQRYLVQLHDRGELVLGGGPRMIRLTNGHIALRERPASPIVEGHRVLADDGRLQPHRR